jgi:hypothetical protein
MSSDYADLIKVTRRHLINVKYRINNLEAELSRLRAELEAKPRIEQCCECKVFVSDWVEAEHVNGRICRPCEHVLTLRAENEELRKDKERLDRLESKSDGSSWIVEDDGYRFALVLTRRDMSYHPDARSTARGAIDAMQTEKEPTK